jgi:hypothetical protein
MHVEPQWANRQLYTPLVNKKRGELKMTPCLVALVKWVVELRATGLLACHCTEELTLWRIHPLDHRERLAYNCPQLADLSREPAGGMMFNFHLFY